MNKKNRYTNRLLSLFFFLFFIFISVSFFYSALAQSDGDSCSASNPCEYHTYGSGTRIRTTSYSCSGGMCVKSGDTVEVNCADFDGRYCSGSTSLYRTHSPVSRGGDVCCGYSTSDSIHCPSLNYYYCNGNISYEALYNCSGGNCNHYDSDLIEDCNPQYSEYCSGDYELRSRTSDCSGSGGCNVSTSHIENCSDGDGNYCLSDEDTLELRDYYCQEFGDDADCEYDSTSYLCSEHNSDSFSAEFGNRAFCKPVGGPGRECESYPIAYDLEWNEEDHNFDFGIHGYDNYDYCNSPTPPSIILEWNYHSQTDHDLERTHIQISKNSDFSDPIIDLPDYQNLNYTFGPEFDTDYYWRVMVYDKNGHSSDWKDESFSTDIRRADINFIWSPTRPFGEEMVHIENLTESRDSTIFNGDYYWEFENGTPINFYGEDPPPVSFGEDFGYKTIRLETIDTEDVCCSLEKMIYMRPELPDWQEIDPF